MNLEAKQTILMPTAYISHGGGPMPLLGRQPDLASFLSDYPKSIPKPSAILIISAHWLTKTVSVTSGAAHSLLFDYGGFPAESYEYTYPAPGSPALASQVCDLLAAKDIPCAKEDTRGWDHGVFVPLKLMYPEADIPVVEMSLLNSLDPLRHLQIGQALAPLREQGVLILASGMSFHNFDFMFGSGEKKARGVQHSKVFNKHLVDTFTGASPTLSKKEQYSLLENWTEAPSGVESHPLGQQEHLIPLHVAFGASMGVDGPTVSNKSFGSEMSGFMSSSFEFN